MLPGNVEWEKLPPRFLMQNGQTWTILSPVTCRRGNIWSNLNKKSTTISATFDVFLSFSGVSSVTYVDGETFVARSPFSCSLLEQLRETKRDDDYDPYDDDLYESHDMSEDLQVICDDFDIKFFGDDLDNKDNDSDVEEVYDETATYKASTCFIGNKASKSGSGGGKKRLYKEWKENYDEEPYDDDDFDDSGLTDAQMKFANVFYINLRGIRLRLPKSTLKHLNGSFVISEEPLMGSLGIERHAYALTRHMLLRRHAGSIFVKPLEDVVLSTVDEVPQSQDYGFAFNKMPLLLRQLLYFRLQPAFQSEESMSSKRQLFLTTGNLLNYSEGIAE
ncbi:hypothetical protein Tco_0581015 [Tanacetum coccineum]